MLADILNPEVVVIGSIFRARRKSSGGPMEEVIAEEALGADPAVLQGGARRAGRAAGRLCGAVRGRKSDNIGEKV